MTACEPMCRADFLRHLAALYPLLTAEELELLADMAGVEPADDSDDD